MLQASVETRPWGLHHRAGAVARDSPHQYPSLFCSTRRRMQCARRRTNCRSRCDESRVAPKLVRNSSSVGRLSDQAMGVCTLVTSSCPKLMLSCARGCRQRMCSLFAVRA